MRFLSIASASMLVVAALAAVPASAATYTVKPDGSGDFPTIQAAISACAAGDVILLTNGSFVGPGNRNISYQGKAITVRSVSDDPSTCIIDLQSAGRGINFFSHEGPGSVLRGVTVMNGYSQTHGAGIWCDQYASPTISHCILADNHSVWTGAGLYCFLEAVPAVDHCVFRHNRADISGGGAQFDLRSSARLANCTFFENSAPHGSGVYGDDIGTGVVTLENCIVAFGLEGEGIFCGNGVNLSCCDVYGNEGGDYVDRLASQYGVNGNIREHPLFCNAEAGDFTLQQDSPCAPFSPPNPECNLIGARPVACPSVDYACCLGSVCELRQRDDCTEAGGTWIPGSACTPGLCLPAACCLIEECRLLFESECRTAGGQWEGTGTVCDPNPCLMARFLVRPDGTGDFPTIQAAVDGVSDRAIIELADGTFTGNGNRDVDYRGKAVVIRSQNGDPARCIIDCQGTGSDPHRGFIFSSEETRNSVLQGVTIINALMEYTFHHAISISEASPQILGNVLINNGITGGGDPGPLVEGNVFRNFQANDIAGVDVSKRAIVRNNTFRDFTSSMANGIRVWGTGYAVNTVVAEGNRFEKIGGAAVDLTGTGAAVITGELQNNQFMACGSSIDAAVSIAGTGGVIVQTTLTGNTIRNGSSAAIRISGLATSQLSGDFRNNTIVNNAYGIIRGTNISHLEIHNTILWDNGDDLQNGVASEVFCSDIGDGDINGVNGNISADPLFCNPSVDDYNLQAGSPCNPHPGCDLMGAWSQGCLASDVPVPDEGSGRKLELICAPNPSHGATTVRFRTPSSGRVKLDIFMVDGRRVATLCDGPRPEGTYTVIWSGSDDRGRPLGTGTYFVRLTSGDAAQSGRIYVIR